MLFYRSFFLTSTFCFLVFSSAFLIAFGQEADSIQVPLSKADSLKQQVEDLNSKATSLFNQNKLEEAAKLFQRAIFLHDSLDIQDNALLFGLYSDLSYAYSPAKLRRPDKQLFYLEKAKEFLNLEKVSPYRAGNFYLDLASISLARYKYEECLGYSLKSYEVYVEQEERAIAELGQANVYLLKAVGLEWVTKSYKNLEDEENMLQTYEELKELRAKAKAHIDLKNSLSVSAFEVGRYYQDKNMEKAVRYFDQSIALAPNEAGTIYPRICKGFAYLEGGQRGQARKLVEELLRIEGLNVFNQLNIHELAARCYAELGMKDQLIFHSNEALTKMNAKGKKVDVLNFVEGDFEHFDHLTYPNLLTQFATFLEEIEDEALSQTANILFRIGLKVFADRITHQPINEQLAIYEIIQNRLLHQMAKGDFSQEEMTDILLQMEKIETQARFNELLANRFLSDKPSNLDSLFKVESEIRQHITQLKKKGQDSLIAQQIFEEEIILGQVKEELEKENKAAFELANAAFQTRQLPQIPETSILKFIVARDQLFRIKLIEGTQEVKDLGSYEQWEKKIDSFLTLVKNPMGQEGFQQVGKAIFEGLLDGIAFEKKTIIIAGRALRYLPFELLQNGENYLLEETAISYANGLMYLSEGFFPEASHKESVSFFAPSYRQYKPNDQEIAIRGEAYDLSGAREEVQSLSRLLGGKVFQDEKATKEEFLNLNTDYSIIHIAGHAFLDDQDPELSNLVFSDLEQDNKLYISELYGFKSNADMAVLSACNSGVGGFKTGKGMVSLSEAFMYAGIPSTVSSLWSAPDQATKKIMLSFYAHLKEGLPKSVALQEAKKEYLQTVANPRLAHPYYWAPFVLYGHDAPIDIKAANTSWMYWLALLLGILAVGTFGLYRRKAMKA